MTSYRGPKGGVTLVNDAQKTSLAGTVSALDGTEMFTECMLGLPGGGHAAPYPAHDSWIEVRQKFADVARRVTLDLLGEKSSELHVRLAREFRVG